MTPNELKSKRAALRLTRRELAEATGYSVRSIVAYEDGWRDISPRFERLLATVSPKRGRPRKRRGV
jgi:transcriptional regulator with XRE-family HTH domain